MTITPAGNMRLAKKRVQCLNEALCFVSSSVLADSLVLRNPLLRQAPNRYLQANLTIMQSNRFYFLILVFIFLLSCKKNQQKKDYINEKMNINSEKIAKAKQNVNSISKIDDTIKISNKHKINTIKCDLDGDKLDETIQIVRNTKNKKSGLRIIYGNRKRIDFLGLGKDILNQGFDEIDWVGIFEIAPKNEMYYNNVNDKGEIISEDEIKEEDKIKLINDGIFIHAEESCGGGIIYLKDGKYAWIQQE